MPVQDGGQPVALALSQQPNVAVAAVRSGADPVDAYMPGDAAGRRAGRRRSTRRSRRCSRTRTRAGSAARAAAGCRHRPAGRVRPARRSGPAGASPSGRPRPSPPGHRFASPGLRLPPKRLSPQRRPSPAITMSSSAPMRKRRGRPRRLGACMPAAFPRSRAKPRRARSSRLRRAISTACRWAASPRNGAATLCRQVRASGSVLLRPRRRRRQPRRLGQGQRSRASRRALNRTIDRHGKAGAHAPAFFVLHQNPAALAGGKGTTKWSRSPSGTRGEAPPSRCDATSPAEAGGFSCAVVASPNGENAASGSAGGTIQLRPSQGGSSADRVRSDADPSTAIRRTATLSALMLCAGCDSDRPPPPMLLFGGRVRATERLLHGLRFKERRYQRRDRSRAGEILHCKA
jgi:hypothetical protein